jgi:Fe-S cluster biogenesis protein NfuA
MMEPLLDRIRQVLVAEIAPALMIAGEDVEVLGLEEGVLRVRLHGACASCPSSIMTVVMGIEQELRRRFPEVEYLEAAP